MIPQIAVVGAGIIGLSTAVQIQEALPHSHVTIVADRFERETVSDGAAGSFRPTVDYIPGVARARLKRWCKDSFAFYSGLAHSPEASQAGVAVLSGYQLFSEGQREKDPIHGEVVYSFRELRPDELHMFPGTENCTSGFAYTSLIVECRWFLPWLMKRFRHNGGQVEKRTIGSLQELARKYDVVVNCTGSASAELVKDEKVSPVRGQMIRVKAPWIKHFLYVDHNCWIIPGKETVTVGGTRQVGDMDLNVRSRDAQDVWNRACRYMPSLKGAEVAWHWAGHRPVRAPVRVEKELLQCGDTTLKVVHNYGHGGNGVSLAWGCGTEATALLTQLLQPARL